jgi:hypothetical protein
VDFAHVAMRGCLYNRITMRPFGDTVPIYAITLGAISGASGNVIIDTTVTLQ